MSGSEYSVSHVLHREIWFGLLFVQGIFPLTHFLGIVEPVPRLDLRPRFDFARLDVLVHNLLHVVDFLLGLSHGWANNFVQEFIHGGRIVSHLVVQLVCSECVKTKHIGLLRPQIQYFKAESLVVIFIAIISP